MIEWYVLALVSALFSASAAIFEKKVLFKEKALAFSTALAIFNLVLAIPFFFFIDMSSVSSISLLVLFFKSILGAFAFLCVMLGIKNLEISNALPLLVLTPGFVAFFAFIFLKEVLSGIELIGMLLLLGGTYILQLKLNQKFLDPFRIFLKSKGHKYIIGALVLFTITSILDKALLKNFKLPVFAFMGFQHLFLAIVFIAIVLFSGKIKEVAKPLKNSWKWILPLAFLTITYRYAQIEAVKAASVALVLSLKRVSVFFAVLIGGSLFNDHSLLRRVLATAVLILGAIFIITG
ncbi:EamA family transporter [Candidatus Woesearchaeota archaeon]|jgi:drug/metabolite transporter (DMT)-like permease|nr:EamA family transporter [Candidatus Woesearchaeota archaeon]MBT4321585.1 EamA family transporter [Candidatus Woesearchaeota archaeon]MBT4631104.1 EamA family transporter [Candidatus Woesearchaeota archaeon]